MIESGKRRRKKTDKGGFLGIITIPKGPPSTSPTSGGPNRRNKNGS